MINLEHLSDMGAALKELRWHARMKQVEVCRATGMTAPQVSRYENGHEMPTVESLVRYLVAVEADLCDLQAVLVTGRKPPYPTTPRDPRDRAAGGPAAGGPAAGRDGVRPPAVEQMLAESDRRLGSSSALQEIVSGLVKLNLEGMERMEQRMQSMESSMDDLKQAGEDKKREAG